MVNEALDTRERRRPSAPLLGDLPDVARIEEALAARERSDSVQAALLRLSAEDREVIVLRHFAELALCRDRRDAGSRRRRASVSRLHEARQRLGRMLGPEIQGDPRARRRGERRRRGAGAAALDGRRDSDVPIGFAENVMRSVRERAPGGVQLSGPARVLGDKNPDSGRRTGDASRGGGGEPVEPKAVAGDRGRGGDRDGYFAVKGFPPVGPGSEATVGATKRYESEQMSSKDVKLDDPQLQAFMQTDTYQRLIADKAAVTALSNASFREALASKDLRDNLASKDYQSALASKDFADALASKDFREALASKDLRDLLASRDFRDTARERGLPRQARQQGLPRQARQQGLQGRTRRARTSAMPSRARTSRTLWRARTSATTSRDKDFRDALASKDFKDALASKDFRDALASKDFKDALASKDFKDALASKDFRDSLWRARTSATASATRAARDAAAARDNADARDK